MNDDERDRLLAEMIERPQERDRIARQAQLSEEDRAELAGLLDTADALWLAAQGAPALEDDPVAAMLGLVPDEECNLDPRAFSRARKRAGLSVSDVAAHLQRRGWEIDTSDVFRWETHSAVDVPPAVIQIVSDILSTPVDDLVTPSASSAVPAYVASVRRHPRFDQLVDRWAKARGVSRAVAISALEGRMLATVHRGERPDTEQLLRSLGTLVDAIERADPA